MNEEIKRNNTGREIEFPEISDNLSDFLTKDAEKLALEALAEAKEPACCEEMEYLPESGLIYFKSRGLIINIRDISCAWRDNEDSNKFHISLRSEYSDILIQMPLENFINAMKQK